MKKVFATEYFLSAFSAVARFGRAEERHAAFPKAWESLRLRAAVAGLRQLVREGKGSLRPAAVDEALCASPVLPMRRGRSKKANMFGRQSRFV